MEDINKRQIYLDAFIDTNHKIDKSERLEFKLSWLLTKISELANKDAWFKYCKEKDTLAYSKRYEEASDCLHLFVSLAHEIGVVIVEPNTNYYYQAKGPDDSKDFVYRSECYKNILRNLSLIDKRNSTYENSMLLLRGFDNYIRFLFSIGLRWDDVKKAYVDKNIKNLKLQLNYK